MIAYHGTFEKFNKFKNTTYLTSNIEMASSYNYNETKEKNRLLVCEFELNNPLVIDCKFSMWNQIEYPELKAEKIYKYYNPMINDYVFYKTFTTEQIQKYAEVKGYDGIIFENLKDGGDIGMYGNPYIGTVYCIFDGSSINIVDDLMKGDLK
jgi:hypothetical protein